MKVLVTDNIDPAGIEILSAEPDIEVDLRPGICHEELVGIIGNYEGLITRSQTAVDAEVIGAGRELRIICRAAIGVDNIDLDAATDRGILVANCPYDNVVSAAEHTMTLLLACCRNLVDAHASLRNSTWDRKSFLGTELDNKVLGIVGLGKVGSRVARMAQGFGMKVIAYDPYITDEKFSNTGAEKIATLDELLQRADVLTIHTPKNEETTGMIGPGQLALLRKGVIVINCARGGIVDETALLDALEDGSISAAGIDVWENEPAVDRPLQKHPRVVMTPHLGANTGEAQYRISMTTAEQVIKALRGQTVDYPVNMPEIKASLVDKMANFVVLAEKMGAFGDQYMDGRVDGIDIMYQGDLASGPADIMTMALIKGFLGGRCEERVTYVNARRKADDRGIRVGEVRDPVSMSYRSALTVVFHRGNESFTLVGTVFEQRYPHIVRVNKFYFDIIPEGTFILLRNQDQPGVIGEIGTILGRARINIARWELGRMKEGTIAMAAISVDSTVPEQVLDEIRSATHVTDVKLIRL